VTADARADRESLPTSPELTAQIRVNFERVRSEVGPDVTVVAATKYASPAQMTLLADAGIEVVGENRLQDLVAKQAEVGDRFRWHFIGHLQSRKAKEVSGLCELVHSLDSLSAAKRLSAPALVEVNLGGEESKSGVSREELPAFLRDVREVGVEVRGLMTMPPLADDPERSRPYFRELRVLAGEHGLTELSMGSSQDYLVAAEEGATLVRVGSVLFGR
jgi:PLP dependent protein